MIACPTCGARTAVAETRAVGAGIRRRRRCVVMSCEGKVTTVEAVINAARGSAIGEVVPVPTRQIAALKKIVASIGGGAE